jgi:hypothetical protein
MVWERPALNHTKIICFYMDDKNLFCGQWWTEKPGGIMILSF